MVCGHLDRNLLAQAITDLLAGDLANLASTSDPMATPGPRCECEEHPAARRAPMPGTLLSTAILPGFPQPGTTLGAASGSTANADTVSNGGGPPGPTGAPGNTVPGGLSPTSGGLARLQDTLLRYAVSLLSGPTGLAAY